MLPSDRRLQSGGVQSCARFRLWLLPRNRPYVFADHLEVAGFHIAEVSSNDEHVAGVAEREVRLILEPDSKVQRTVL